MRYVVFGDIHGNLEALEAVLEATEKDKPDHYICVGDIVGYGADPKECLRKVRALNNCTIVAGNHDFASAGILNLDFFNDHARESISWTTEQLSDEDKKFLSQLKLINHVNHLAVVHSNLHQPEMFGYIQTVYDLQLGLKQLETPVCFVGHSHIPVIFLLHRATISVITEPVINLDGLDRAFINVGSVGQPRDENSQASYVLYDEDEKKVAIKRVNYSIEKVVNKIKKAGLPEMLAERLKYGR